MENIPSELTYGNINGTIWKNAIKIVGNIFEGLVQGLVCGITLHLGCVGFQKLF
jgi:hypothetical protein